MQLLPEGAKCRANGLDCWCLSILVIKQMYLRQQNSKGSFPSPPIWPIPGRQYSYHWLLVYISIGRTQRDCLRSPTTGTSKAAANRLEGRCEPNLIDKKTSLRKQRAAFITPRTQQFIACKSTGCRLKSTENARLSVPSYGQSIARFQMRTKTVKNKPLHLILRVTSTGLQKQIPH